MLNRDIYQKDPTTHKLINQGVASVNDEKTSQAMEVLRYELETFVCDGQYERGLSHILETFLKNIDQAQQPAVWVSGFYGSGKSHLVKMLRALWVNTTFEDGATARGLAANLPPNIIDHLKELDTQAKRHGGLHAASGTLGAGASGSVRLALLRIIFNSVGLPEQYQIARFVMWLKQEGIYNQIRDHVEKNGFDWNEELDNFIVAEGLHEALVQAKPNLFSLTTCTDILINLYPNVQDISSDEMLKAIRQALTKDDKFPLTLVVLDEVQQYIGEDSQRSIDVQEVVEACSKNIGGKLLFIGTGQTAVTGTSNLKKLEGRFTIRVELSDADVDAVVRQVVLAKKPEAKNPIQQVMQDNLGEISRHLAGTTIGHQQNDVDNFLQDYPILPVRRRFWENTLRVLDQTGTDSQLRNQLSMIHKVIQSNLNEPLGNVVPADYLYFDSADKLLTTRILPRKVHEKTLSWIKSESYSDQLMARACGLVFLINKLASSNNEIGIHATIDTIADLMVEDLSSSSSTLRSQLPDLLDNCELLMKVGDEYRIQTEESSAWNDEFLSQRSALSNEAHRISAERDDRIRKKFGEMVRKLSLTQGDSKVTRDIHPVFDSQLPTDSDQRISAWVRDGWSIDENSVLADARQAGNQSPTVFIFIPKRSADDLRHYLIDYKASSATLDKRGYPNTPEGTEARSAMETIKQTSEGKIRELLEEAFFGARVFQGGGIEILGDDLQGMVLESASNALQRLYPHFHTADHAGWPKVYEKAKVGAPDALKAVGYEGELTKNPVCKAILGSISSGKKGTDIRTQFELSPYGWSRDAVDGGLQVLLVAGQSRAIDERGQTIDPKELERKAIGKVMFKVESATVTTAQRIQIRKLLQKVGLSVKQGEELTYVPNFLQKMLDLASHASGEVPKPAQPDTAFINEIRLTAGNEQLLALYNRRDELSSSIDSWNSLAEHVNKRWPNWVILKRLMFHASGVQGIDVIKAQVKVIEQQRQLLDDPDLITPLVTNLTQLLRNALNKLESEYTLLQQQGKERLAEDSNWQQLEPEQRNKLLSEQRLTLSDQPKVEVQSTIDVLTTLDNCNLSMFTDRVAAMPARFDNVANRAAELCEPQAQFIQLPRRTLKTEAEIDEWINDARQQLITTLENGPIVIR